MNWIFINGLLPVFLLIGLIIMFIIGLDVKQRKIVYEFILIIMFIFLVIDTLLKI